MKLEKITEKAGRRYHDACGAAHGLDLLGERWALLVVRELMLGARRFNELRGDLCGLSANVLTQRLAGLEAAGVVRRRRLPPPASVQVYELTEWGLEAEPIFQVLGRWAARSPAHDPTLPLSGVSLMLSFRTMFRAGAEATDLTVAMRLREDDFVVRIRGADLTVAREEVEAADLRLATTPEAVAGAVYGGLPLPDGALVAGTAEAFARFATHFELPPKAG